MRKLMIALALVAMPLTVNCGGGNDNRPDSTSAPAFQSALAEYRVAEAAAVAYINTGAATPQQVQTVSIFRHNVASFTAPGSAISIERRVDLLRSYASQLDAISGR